MSHPHEQTISDLANALQAAAPLADRLGVTAVQQAHDAAALKRAVVRAVEAVRALRGSLGATHMPIGSPITDEQIEQLRQEAGEAGDREMVAICDLALGDTRPAIGQIAATSPDGAYALVRYPSGEARVEHAASGTCSVWLPAQDVAAIEADPASMEQYRTDETLDPVLDRDEARAECARVIGERPITPGAKEEDAQ